MMSTNFYTLLPSNVRYDKRLKAMEKIMYSEITGLINEKGYCNKNNSYFAKLYGVHKNTISLWINHLETCGYIKTITDYKENTKQIKGRKIFINVINEDGQSNTYKSKPGHNNIE